MVQTCKSDPSADRLRCCAEAGDLLEPEFFKALCDATRLEVLLRLLERGAPATVSEVAGCCPVDLSVVSRHLAVLRRAGIVAAERQGKEVFHRPLYTPLAAHLRRLADAIEACCPQDNEAIASSKPQ